MENIYRIVSLSMLFLCNFSCAVSEQAVLNAAYRGDMRALRENIECAPAARGAGGVTALHVGLENDQTQVAHYLMRRVPVLIDVQTGDGDTPLYIAIKRGLYDIAYWLIRLGADVNLGAGHGRAPLHIAVLRGHVPTIEALLCAQVRLDVPFFRNGETVLHLAAAEGHDDAVRLLLLYGCAIEGKDLHGRTPLNRVCERGHLSTAWCLIQAGADMHASSSASTSYYGTTHIEKAISYGQNPVINCLLGLWVMGAWKQVEGMDEVYVYAQGERLPVFLLDSAFVQRFKNRGFSAAIKSLKEKVEVLNLDHELPSDLKKLVISFVAAREDLDAALRFTQQDGQEEMAQFLRSIGASQDARADS